MQRIAITAKLFVKTDDGGRIVSRIGQAVPEYDKTAERGGSTGASAKQQHNKRDNCC
jgi:hypothetical protein